MFLPDGPQQNLENVGLRIFHGGELLEIDCRRDCPGPLPSSIRMSAGKSTGASERESGIVGWESPDEGGKFSLVG